MKKCLIFGNGYVAKHLSQKLRSHGWQVIITTRQAPHQSEPSQTLIHFMDPQLGTIIQGADAIISTVPPHQDQDPVLQAHYQALSQSAAPWIGYLSTTSVYGNHQGAWVDEDSACHPSHPKSQIRLDTEMQWLKLHEQHQIPCHIFRLSGIYGPGRCALDAITQGKKHVIFKEDHCFSRIHVDDIAKALFASIIHPTPGEIFNVSDNEPTGAHIIYQHAAKLLGIAPLKQIPINELELSDNLNRFYQDHKKIANTKITQRLHLQWQYPTYREGLAHCLNRKKS